MFRELTAVIRASSLWPRRVRRDGLPFGVTGWTVRGYLDALGHPIMIIANSDGREVALDYSAATKREVPLDWARALGVEVDSARFDGAVLASRFRERTPFVVIGGDGSAVIVTGKGALTRRPDTSPQWRRGFHVPLAEYRSMRLAGPRLTQAMIRESQAAMARRVPVEVPVDDDDPVAKNAAAIARDAIERAAAP
jgi:hypothetical protein